MGKGGRLFSIIKTRRRSSRPASSHFSRSHSLSHTHYRFLERRERERSFNSSIIKYPLQVKAAKVSSSPISLPAPIPKTVSFFSNRKILFLSSSSSSIDFKYLPLFLYLHQQRYLLDSVSTSSCFFFLKLKDLIFPQKQPKDLIFPARCREYFLKIHQSFQIYK